MASPPSHTLFFALARLLLLLFLIHESQSSPNPIHFDCPDHAYDKGNTTLDFPFTNSTLPECGVCVLTCDSNHNTMINCRGLLEDPKIPNAAYQVLDINPSNHTMLLEYPNACDAYTYLNANFPSTQNVTFTILESFETIICPYEEDDPPEWDIQHYSICRDHDQIAYGPYKDGQLPTDLPPPPPDCSRFQFPEASPVINNSPSQYNISFHCPSCIDETEADRNHRRKGTHVRIILGTVLPISAIILGALLFVYWQQRKKKSGSSTLHSRNLSFNRIRSDLEVGSMNGVTVYSYTELEEATNNFDSAKQLGEGGFGVVYYGKLRDGREVAVKRLYEKSYKRIEQFKNEIRILTDLRHQYLVTLYGCTSRHTRELLLVYEYIPNGTVADHLHGEKTKSRLLPWPARMSIAIETATALSYLHFNDIIHRDVKTNNILLDNSFSVKVADFGLSRLFPADVTHISTAPQGTPGYVDPEYHQCYHLTDKSDVFSFGVVLIELISSLLAVDVGRDRHEINLSTYAMNRIQASALSDLIDPDLGFETNFKVRRMTSLVAELASQCLQHDRELRPSMEEVLEILKKIESEDYDALEAEEANWSTGTTDTPKPPPSPTDNDGIELLRNARQPPLSPISVMNKWVSSSKSTTSKFSYTSNSR